jgi:uncharacterized protein (TIGR00375 family)
LKLIVDLHIHSKYSYACSPDMDVEGMAHWCALKGIDVVATGDYCQPLYYKELREKLVEAEPGLYRKRDAKEFREDGRPTTRFLCSVEISLIYKDGAKTRKIHHLVLAPDLEVAGRIGAALAKVGRVDADGRPIFGMSSRDLCEIVWGVSEDCAIIPAHAWTPWFSIFGSKSGYDSIEECFGPYAKKIFAIETGLSSDRPMNERLSMLDGLALVSNSDAHSPAKLGREANVLDCELSYKGILGCIRENDPRHFLYTIEFFPEEGKYHMDGHRDCRICLHPRESIEKKLKCPSCHRPLTLGVMHRVEALADRPWDFKKPAGGVGQKSIIPLEELIADAFDCGVGTKKVREEYLHILAQGGNEFRVLLDAPKASLEAWCQPKVAEGILRVRRGEVKIAPGYDGEFGKISIFRNIAKSFVPKGGVQMKLV